MGERNRKRESDDEREKESLRSALRSESGIEKVRESAEFGIRYGLQSGTNGAVNITEVSEANSQFRAMFAHNPGLERSATGGVALVWVLIPKSEEEEIRETMQKLRGLRRPERDDSQPRN